MHVNDDASSQPSSPVNDAQPSAPVKDAPVNDDASPVVNDDAPPAIYAPVNDAPVNDAQPSVTLPVRTSTKAADVLASSLISLSIGDVAEDIVEPGSVKENVVERTAMVEVDVDHTAEYDVAGDVLASSLISPSIGDASAVPPHQPKDGEVAEDVEPDAVKENVVERTAMVENDVEHTAEYDVKDDDVVEEVVEPGAVKENVVEPKYERPKRNPKPVIRLPFDETYINPRKNTGRSAGERGRGRSAGERGRGRGRRLARTSARILSRVDIRFIKRKPDDRFWIPLRSLVFRFNNILLHSTRFNNFLHHIIILNIILSTDASPMDGDIKEEAKTSPATSYSAVWSTSTSTIAVRSTTFSFTEPGSTTSSATSPMDRDIKEEAKTSAALVEPSSPVNDAQPSAPVKDAPVNDDASPVVNDDAPPAIYAPVNDAPVNDVQPSVTLPVRRSLRARKAVERFSPSWKK
ncbi:unnamed protein product [Trifolium pratense]|uniref:Uncharacterized protein n=1 Tax=Trifolium pratense TaxID=57577 RepID=A0ACB0KHT6_TRIPR|nr:unnamed protein product [Trifolium pratense]